MILWSVFIVIFLAVAAQSEVSLVQPCLMKDTECLIKSTTQFLENTSKGLPNYDIRAIEPLIIETLDFDLDKDFGIRFHFKNLNVTGLRSQKLTEFKMNTLDKRVLLKTKADLHIVGDITIELTKASKKFSGIYNADSTVFGTARYNYKLKTDDKGVEHFEVGPETIECESVTEPVVTLSADLQTALANDPAAQAILPSFLPKQVSLRKKAVCKIAEKGYVNMVHNIRVSANNFPKSTFFKDV